MKMSPLGVNLSTDMVEFCIRVIDRNLSFQRFIELHLGTSEAKALGLGRDLEASSVPLHDVVVANDALVMKAADVVEIFGSGAPSGFGFARSATEAPIVVRQEAAQDLVGGNPIVGSGQTQFTGETILESSPEAFDASFGLRAAGRDVGDGELLQSAAELRRLAATGELFFHRPVIVIANEDAVTIAVKTERDAEAAKQALEQAKITARVFGREEFG